MASRSSKPRAAASLSRICAPSLDKRRGRVPVGEPTGISQRRTTAEHGLSGLDVGSCIEHYIKHCEVIAACGPMQRRLGVRAEPAMSVHISASGNQTLHDPPDRSGVTALQHADRRGQRAVAHIPRKRLADVRGSKYLWQ